MAEPRAPRSSPVEGSQASRPARRAVADAVIANDADCSLEDLRLETRQVATLFGL